MNHSERSSPRDSLSPQAPTEGTFHWLHDPEIPPAWAHAAPNKEHSLLGLQKQVLAQAVLLSNACDKLVQSHNSSDC